MVGTGQRQKIILDFSEIARQFLKKDGGFTSTFMPFQNPSRRTLRRFLRHRPSRIRRTVGKTTATVLGNLKNRWSDKEQNPEPAAGKAGSLIIPQSHRKAGRISTCGLGVGSVAELGQAGRNLFRESSDPQNLYPASHSWVIPLSLPWQIPEVYSGERNEALWTREHGQRSLTENSMVQ